MDENNMTAAGQTAPAAAQTEAPAEATEQTVTVGALRGAIERRQEQNMRRAAEQTAARWSREADELTAQCPDFDLGAALKDDRFCALLRAGIDVRTAWFALHAQALLETACLRAGHAAIAADDRTDVRAAFTVAVTGLRQLAVAYPGHVAEGTGRTPAQEEPNGSAAAGCCPGAVPGSGQQRKKET